MKAAVLEIKNKYAAVLTKDGRVERIPDRGYTVGQEIEMPKKSIIYSGAFRTIAAAAALFIVITGLGITGYRRNLKEYAYVTVDVNPSLEYAVNAKRKVLKVSALNADAEAIAERLTRDGIRGQELESALQNTKDVLYEDGFLGEEKDNAMLISVVTDDESMRSDLKAAAESVAAAEDVAVYVVDASISERKEAQEKGISTGRYEVSRQLADQSPEETEKAQKGSVKELVEAGDVPQVVADPVAVTSPTAAATATVAVSEGPTEAPAASIPPTATPKPGKKPTPTPAKEDDGTGNSDPTATPAAEITPVATEAPSPTAAAAPTEGSADPTATATPTVTPTPAATATPTPKPGGPVASPTPTPKPGPRPTDPPTPIPEPTVTPTEVPTETPTPTETPAEEQPEQPTPEERPEEEAEKEN